MMKNGFDYFSVLNRVVDGFIAINYTSECFDFGTRLAIYAGMLGSSLDDPNAVKLLDKFDFFFRISKSNFSPEEKIGFVKDLCRGIEGDTTSLINAAQSRYKGGE